MPHWSDVTSNGDAEARASNGPHVRVNSANSAEDVRAFNLDLRSAIDCLQPNNAIALHLDSLTGQIPQKSVGRYGPLISNILLNDINIKTPLKVSPPSSSSSAAQLARSGVMYALARHKSDLRTTNQWSTDSENNFFSGLDRWRQDWQPVAPKSTLFELSSEIEGIEPDQFDDHVVAFLNPSPSRIDLEARENAIYPWLRKIIPNAKSKNAKERTRILRDISSVTTELLDNILDHAGASQSFMIISAIRSRSGPTLQISIVDNGRGVAGSLAKKYSDVKDTASYLTAAFNGQLSRRAKGRGYGLSQVATVVNEYKGSILFATGSAEVDKTTVFDHNFAHSDVIKSAKLDNLGIRGTVAVVRLPL